MKKHSFSVELAEKYGIVEALMLDYFYFWVQNNQKKSEEAKYAIKVFRCKAKKHLIICLLYGMLSYVRGEDDVGFTG